MRGRLRRLSGRSMARRPGEEGSVLNLSPRALRIGGWVVAALLIGGIAVAVGFLGGDADETGADPSPSGSLDGETREIAFGTALDATSGEVAADARTERFVDGDTFAYSVTSAVTPPDAVYVEVQRTAGGEAEVVQAPVDPQPLPNPAVIAFRVPTADLLAVFGPGQYLMLIYADPAEDPIAEGTFELVGQTGHPSTSASPNP